MTAAVLTAADGDLPDIPGQPYVSPDDLASIGPMWQQAVQQQLVPVVAEVYQTSAGVVHAQMVDATQVPTLPSVGSLAAEQYLAAASNTFEQVGDDLWATARSELLDGFEKGESIDQLAARLRASAGMTAKKAVLVARTQVLDASNAGSIATARASGIDMQKEWMSAEDLRVRPEHVLANGQKVDLNGKFTVGGYECDRPHDPTLPPALRYSCRCTTGYLIPDDSVDDAVRDAEPVAPIPGTSGVVEPLPDPYAGDLVAPALPGPGVGVPGEAAPGPGLAVRPVLEAARTTSAVQSVFAAETRRITGRFIPIRFTGSAATAREHAEGLLRGLERFPDARLGGVDAMEARGSAYAATSYNEILFSELWTSPAARRHYLGSVASDVQDGWHVANSGNPVAIALHEFGHLLDFTTDINRGVRVRIREIVARRAAAEGVGQDVLIRREVSGYATSHTDELVAEAFTDVMINGEAASGLSREIFTLLEDAYRQAGGTVRAVVERELAFSLPSPTAGLASRTVPQLRALAKERGITIPPGSKKADIVRLLDEGPTPGPVPTPPTFRRLLPKPETTLTTAEQARVTELVRQDPQIFATVQDRFGKISTSGNLSQADADWLDAVYRRERAFVEREVQEAQIQRLISDAARQAGQTVTEYRATVGARLKEIFDDKPIAVRVRDEAALRAILSGGRFKTQLEGARRAPGLKATPETRILGEKIMGVADDVPVEQRPVYGYVAIHDIEPALSAGRKIRGEAFETEGQEDLLSTYGQVQVILRPEIRARTTATAGDSLDELGFVRPSPVDAPTADSLGAVRLSRLDDPDFTRTGYVEAQIHGGVRTDDIAMVVFPEAPDAATIAALDGQRIPWRVLGRNDPPLTMSDVVGTRVTIPPGSKKADIVRLLDEGPPGPAAPSGLLTPVQFDARATAALDGAQAEAAIPVHARITAPGSEPSTWRATGFNGAAADPEAVKAVTQYLRRPGAMNERLRFPDDPTHPLHEQTLDELLGYEPANPVLVAEAAARADAQIAAIDRVMAQSLMPSESVTWRGVSMRALGDVPTDLVGYEWTDLGFVSTSTTRSVAENSFAGSGALLRIVVPEGTQALGFTGLGEAEMLLGRGLRYRIVADRGLTSEGARLLDVEIVPAGAAPAVAVPAVEVPLAKRTVAQLRALAADRNITVPKGAKKPDIVRLLEAPPLTEAEQRAAVRALARETNTLIEQTSATARVLAEVDELLAKKATASTIREAIADALAEPGQLFAGADPAVLAALRAVASDPVKLRAAVTRLGGKAKIKPVSKAGAKVTFDADTMEGVGGIDIPAGARVTVVRRGSTVTLSDGTVMQLEKARVTPVTTPVKAVPTTPPVRRPAATQSPSVEDYSGDYAARQAQLRAEHGGEPTIVRLEGGISSVVELRTYPDGYRLVRKDYSKHPDNPNRKASEFDRIPTDHEELAAQVLDAFDLPTPAVVRVNPHTVEMEFVDGVQGGQSGVLKAPASVTSSEQGRRLGLADAIMGLRDRNGGGWMRVGDGIVPIDNGGAFSGVGPDQAAFGNPFVSYLMNRNSWKPAVDVDPVELARIRTRLMALRPEFDRLGQGRAHKDMIGRLDEIAKRAVGKPVVKAVKSVPTPVEAQVSVAEARKLLKFQEVVDAMIQHGALKEGVGDLILEQAARDIGISAAARDQVIKALLTGSADETRAAMAAVFRDIGVKTAAKPGTVVSFDPKIHVAPGRVKVPPGTKVRISEPGLQIQDRGKTVILTKTRVEPMGTSPTRAVTPEVQRVADLSQTGEVVRRPLGGGMTGEVHEVTYQNGQVLVRKELGRRAEDVRAVAEQIDAEELAPLVYQALGVRVPATYRATDRVIYMARVEGRTGEEVLGWGQVPGPDMLDSDQGRMMGLGDWLVQDTDRNMGGFIIDANGDMWSLDHGFAFQRGVEDSVGGQFEFAGHFEGLTNDMSPADMAEIRARLEGLRGQFEAVGRLAWWRAMMKRVDAVAKGATGTGTRL